MFNECLSVQVLIEGMACAGSDAIFLRPARVHLSGPSLVPRRSRLGQTWTVSRNVNENA